MTHPCDGFFNTLFLPCLNNPGGSIVVYGNQLGAPWMIPYKPGTINVLGVDMDVNHCWTLGGATNDDPTPNTTDGSIAFAFDVGSTRPVCGQADVCKYPWVLMFRCDLGHQPLHVRANELLGWDGQAEYAKIISPAYSGCVQLTQTWTNGTPTGGTTSLTQIEYLPLGTTCDTTPCSEGTVARYLFPCPAGNNGVPMVPPPLTAWLLANPGKRPVAEVGPGVSNVKALHLPTGTKWCFTVQEQASEPVDCTVLMTHATCRICRKSGGDPPIIDPVIDDPYNTQRVAGKTPPKANPYGLPDDPDEVARIIAFEQRRTRAGGCCGQPGG